MLSIGKELGLKLINFSHYLYQNSTHSMNVSLDYLKIITYHSSPNKDNQYVALVQILLEILYLMRRTQVGNHLPKFDDLFPKLSDAEPERNDRP